MVQHLSGHDGRLLVLATMILNVSGFRLMKTTYRFSYPQKAIRDRFSKFDVDSTVCDENAVL
jgi:hypothetical protein